MWGIMGALTAEVSFLRDKLGLKLGKTKAGKNFYTGDYLGKSLVLVETGIGKVNAAMTAQILMDYFPVDMVTLAGTAGSLMSDLKIGDLVVGTETLQHDVSRTGKAYATEGCVDSRLIYSLDTSLVAMVQKQLDLSGLHINGRQVDLRLGRILTGDRVIADGERAQLLVEKFNGICVEMEGAAVAQVCHANAVPLLLLRIISDQADERSAVDFNLNLQAVCNLLTDVILQVIAKVNT